MGYPFYWTRISLASVQDKFNQKNSTKEKKKKKKTYQKTQKSTMIPVIAARAQLQLGSKRANKNFLLTNTIQTRTEALFSLVLCAFGRPYSKISMVVSFAPNICGLLNRLDAKFFYFYPNIYKNIQR